MNWVLCRMPEWDREKSTTELARYKFHTLGRLANILYTAHIPYTTDIPDMLGRLGTWPSKRDWYLELVGSSIPAVAAVAAVAMYSAVPPVAVVEMAGQLRLILEWLAEQAPNPILYYELLLLVGFPCRILS